MKERKSQTLPCEFCSYYEYNDESGIYECFVSMDEDEMVSFAAYGSRSCPYFHSNDDYKIVRKQN